ncbi:hypothetical protein SERLA73DRAFT_178334 [Serpula lacrymans var. lacrymans S7.3]|uniref:Histone deacetylase n=2 Tax=Serpula lacrymans var. lacrymans TaxID=341189 RepID=F8PRB4_SERL3|nr:uncharacterized protein SERLADRAFT_462682 [Serpula lacrymans var. lacrymans S7.9]EGO02405.1 hypothetical protein SERLA73DRAFT_178334 [Serpula lacrymans var. lacrymans S7.3]EGO28131.1 hypothetical protein SERLADRAFT_462682 [Serpula lacrymans var. lacrymans S7.9]
MSKRRVAYYYDGDVGSFTYGLGHLMKPHRMRVAHDLITAYGMLDKMHVLRPKRASAKTMTSFHTDEYVHFLSRVTPETAEELTYHGTRFLMGDDNPPFEGVFDFCSISAGGSICAAERIASGSADIAINWAGGLHHAKKREAAGFCYINDIVLGILELLRTFPRVLYVDIDCHHGDGVEEAFYTTDRVMTCSFHKFGEYFPGTGTQDDKGKGKGKGYAVNVPFKDGLTDEAFKSVFEPVVARCLEVFRPSVVVLQCGGDSIAGDKLGCFNITMHGHAHCVQFIRKKNIPLILLGGGGYTVKNVARAWAYETACALGIEDTIDPNLPWNEYFEWFGPRYRLEVLPNNMEDYNVRDGALDKVRTTALEQLSELAGPPSVGMHDVPRQSLGHHLGFRGDTDSEATDELDERLAQYSHFVYKQQEEAEAESAESDDEDEWDSDGSTRSRRRRQKSRMSIVSNKYTDGIDEHLGGKSRRRFFQSSAKWDETQQCFQLKNDMGLMGLGGMSALMEAGGRMSRMPSVDGEINMDEDRDWEDNVSL